MEKTKIWKVENETLIEIKPTALKLEEQLHEWIEKDISIIIPNAVLVGSKVKTDHCKELDLLAIGENGDLIIIELKRGLTPRDVTAQALDYAAWVNTLTGEDIITISEKHGTDKSVTKFINDNAVDMDNINQQIYIVASEIDSTTERICRYLASNGLQINVLTFSYYEEDGKKFLARNFLVTEEFSHKEDNNKKSGRYRTKLFQENKLQINQKVKYLPIEEKGKEIIATIFREGSKCLKLDSTGEEFSFSGLRTKIIVENNLSLNPLFTYTLWKEWALLEDGTKLSDL